MKSKATNVLILIATVFCIIGFCLNCLIYYDPQSAFLSLLGAWDTEVHVTNYSSNIYVVLLVIAYVTACIVVRTKERKHGWIACLITLIVNIVLNIANVISTIYGASLANMQGADYLAGYQALNICRQYLETPFLFLAIVFLSITLGTLCERKN